MILVKSWESISFSQTTLFLPSLVLIFNHRPLVYGTTTTLSSSCPKRVVEGGLRPALSVQEKLKNRHHKMSLFLLIEVLTYQQFYQFSFSEIHLCSIKTMVQTLLLTKSSIKLYEAHVLLAFRIKPEWQFNLFWNLRSLLHFFHSLWQRHVLRVTFYFELMESMLVCFILILQVISRKDVSVQDFRYKVRTYRYMNLSVTFTEFHCLKHF